MLYIILVLFLLVGGALTVLTIQNFSNPTHLMLFAWLTPALPVGLLVLFAFLLGALLLYLVSVLSAWRDKREISRLNKRVEGLEQQFAARVPSTSPPVQTPPMVPMPGMPAPPTQSEGA